MIELKEVLIVVKPVEGIYGTRINLHGKIETQKVFNQLCQEIKQEAGLMQNTENTYEFLPQNDESIQTTIFRVAKQLGIPVLFY